MAAAPAPLTLDEAAAMLISLDGSDRDGIQRAQMALATATTDDRFAAAAFAAAASILFDALSASEADACKAIEGAAWKLEAAMLARDGEDRPSADTDAAEAARPAVNLDPAQDAASTLPHDADLGLLRDFIAESREYIEQIESALLRLENDPDDAESINTIFRAFHTIKGTSAFLGLDRITTFAHHAESLLSGVRDRGVPFTRAYADLALQATDMLGSFLEVVERASPGEALDTPSGWESVLARMAAAVRAAESGEAPPAPVPTVVHDPPAPAAAVPAEDHAPPAAARESRKRVADASVRVRTDRLDRLIDMMGELVIAHAMIAQDTAVVNGGGQELSRKVVHAGKIVRELQELSMSMRMVPLRTTFQKMARLTRDAARRSGKEVELVIEGEDTEIDRNMVDIIGDPLVHMVRNAVDHGIEPPDVRIERGKPATGRLRIAAYHAGGSVVVEVSDDGKGLDRERIVRKAVANGLIESDKSMSDSDVYKLIFAAGFSTSDTVTDLSGRGVGMDVVRRNIESIQGRIEIASEAGQGTRFTIRLPLTLAVTDGMSVRVGTERYIIPTIHIQLSFRPDAGAISTIAGRGEMVLLRDELMPLVRIHRLFDIQGAIESPVDALLVVVTAGDRRCALLVDELLGQQQVVAKPLGDGIGRVPGIAGSAILGDGRVGLILDVPEMMTLTQQREPGERRRRPRPRRRPDPAAR